MSFLPPSLAVPNPNEERLSTTDALIVRAMAGGRGRLITSATATATATTSCGCRGPCCCYAAGGGGTTGGGVTDSIMVPLSSGISVSTSGRSSSMRLT